MDEHIDNEQESKAAPECGTDELEEGAVDRRFAAIAESMPDEYPTGYARFLAEQPAPIEPGRCPCALPGCSDAAYHRSRGTGAVVGHEHAAGVDR